MKRKKEGLFKKTVYRTILLILSIVSLIAGLLITIEFGTNNKEEKVPVLSYENKGVVDYTVSLKDNSVYENSTITQKNIISKYIDSIDVIFKYEFSSSKEINSNITYIIKMKMINTYSNNNKKEVLLEKEYELIPSTNVDINGQAVIYLDDEIRINYDEYNEIARSIRNESGVLTESTLVVEMSMKNDINNSNLKGFKDDHTLTLSIPLLENITEITKNGEFNQKDTVYNVQEVEENYIGVSIGFLLVIVSICFVIMSVKRFIEVSNLSAYMSQKNKILRRYADVIAQTKEKPDLSSLEIIDIEYFIDLINIEEELRIPILFYETEKGKESWFAIIHNDKAYRYVLKIANKSKKK